MRLSMQRKREHIRNLLQREYLRPNKPPPLLEVRVSKSGIAYYVDQRGTKLPYVEGLTHVDATP